MLLIKSLFLVTHFLSLATATPPPTRFRGYDPKDPCPRQCGLVGTDPQDWAVYYSLEALDRCTRPLLLDFKLDASVPDVNSSTQNITLQRIEYDGASGDSLVAARAVFHIQRYLEKNVEQDNNVILFSKSGNATVGFFGGALMDTQRMATSLLPELIRHIAHDGLSNGVLEQICGTRRNVHETWGIIVSFSDSMSTVQETVRTWSQGKCVTPMAPMARVTSSHSAMIPTMAFSRKPRVLNARTPTLHRRAECSTIKVLEGDSCGTLANRCGVSGADFGKYNTQSNLCSSLQPGQHVCCSAGTLPDFRPKPNPDGSCATYTVMVDESCKSIATANSITLEDLDEFNKKTWGKFTEFCTYSSSESGAPGTAAPGENGCISNCNANVVSSGPPEEYLRIGYFEGYNLGRACLNMDAGQIDTEKYTHIHFGFGTLTEDFNVKVGDALSQFEFEQFKQLTGVKRILSIGGWDFSTSPDTYTIFREGVKSANRMTMAENIANFVEEHDLDGVDIDWEYPGAPDIPGIPSGSEDEGVEYAIFLILLKGLLPDKSLSIAAPASYWYLRPYQIAALADVLDYLVFMTYDLHGQWDHGNHWAAPGCEEGNCLRSHVNLTETYSALSMVTKAGMPSNKVITGIASFGRAFKMTTPGCTGPDCHFTGATSGARAGRCTATQGYLSVAEIDEILNTNPSADTWTDGSLFNVLVYNETEWFAYMDDANKADRDILYKGLNFGGTVEWATSMHSFHEVPPDALLPGGSVSDIIKEWPVFVETVINGKSPFIHGDRNGHWADGSITCTDDAVVGVLDIPSLLRWEDLDCSTAWQDALDKYRQFDIPRNLGFTASISDTFHATQNMDCGILNAQAFCARGFECHDSKGEGSGPAGYEIMNSLSVYKSIYDGIGDAAGAASDNNYTMSFNLFMDTLGLIIPVGMAPIFNNVLRANSYFTANPSMLDNAKDATYTLVGSWVNLAKDSNPGDYGWDEEDHWEFMSFMSKVWHSWQNETERASQYLFSGTEDAISDLTKLIRDGQLIQGSLEGNKPTVKMTATDIQALIERAFYGYLIPRIWQSSGTRAFVIDTNHACDGSNPISDYLDDIDAETAAVCFEDKLYYVAYPDGNAGDTCQLPGSTPVCVPLKFKVPPGLESLTGAYDEYGGVVPADIVASTVRSYQTNGNKNGWKLKNMGEVESVDDLNVDALITYQIGAPGFSTLPLCSAEEAHLNWGIGKVTDNYPCN
ncbi:chitinase [Aspergillus oryzae 100-8]|uniref:chitinase n=1 Tax=Aspergillus oryzae (strain 3.042) TaxID=1160506 RepID=I8TJ79_ASPO3|nr:chitinase [Aspergillus oryzae 3.042]KDE78576.1 chitinase [Aspergillus oryzae 100-8]|eukprot:EIT73813.1 chitinase [Aspergillus oryzae 3.042]